jgi:hypothetical protein
VTDPLRPFQQLIRSLWRERTEGVKRSSPPATAKKTAPLLESRLKARIGGLDPGNAGQLRQAFVETVLLWELGEQLSQDPAFGDMAARVSEQLAADPAVADNLNQMLSRFAGTRATR